MDRQILCKTLFGEEKPLKFRQFGWKNSCGKLHLGADFEAKKGEIVFSPLDGEIVSKRRVNGYGGVLGQPGGVIWVKHLDNHTGEVFFLQYGHVNSGYEVGKIIKQGEKLCRVHDYIGLNGELWNHLHLGVAIADIPDTPWGYSKKVRNFVCPFEYLTPMLGGV